MTHYAICWERGREFDALTIATALRRSGIATDCALSGKAAKQFDRAKRDGAFCIATVRQDGSLRVWHKWRSGIDATRDDFIAYARWIDDDTDTLAEPPEYMITA